MIPKLLKIVDYELMLGHVVKVKQQQVVLVEQVQSSFVVSNRKLLQERPCLHLVEEAV